MFLWRFTWWRDISNTFSSWLWGDKVDHNSIMFLLLLRWCWHYLASFPFLFLSGSDLSLPKQILMTWTVWTYWSLVALFFQEAIDSSLHNCKGLWFIFLSIHLSYFSIKQRKYSSNLVGFIVSIFFLVLYYLAQIWRLSSNS